MKMHQESIHGYGPWVINLENSSYNITMSNFNPLSSETIINPASHNVLSITGSGRPSAGQLTHHVIKEVMNYRAKKKNSIS